MKIEIDQSGKIEDTNRDTVLAYANGKSRSIRVTGKTKRRIQEIYRQTGKPRLFVINTFTVAIYLLVKKDIVKLSELVIDEEYSGKEMLIESLLRKMIGEKGELNITFHRIGKSSNAHELALKVFQNKKKADEILSFEKIQRHSMQA